MTIYSQLESAAKRDIELLNKAMLILYQVQSNPNTEGYIKDKIEALEKEVKHVRESDERFNNSSVPIDLNKWEFKERK